MTPGMCMLGLSLLVVTGCASVDRASARSDAPAYRPETATEVPQSRAPQDSAAVEAPRPEVPRSAAATAAPAPAEAPAPAPAEAAAPVPAVVAPAPAAPARSVAPAPTPKAVATPPAKAPAQPARPAATPSPTAKPVATAGKPAASASAGSSSAGSSDAAASKPAGGEALNLSALEKRLKDTSAIGVMTKITLKNQVDELVERFKAYHEGRDKIPLAQLRQPYDSLIMKVLSLLQDKDPSLASSIAQSREAIWSILIDRNRFSSL